MTLAGFWNWWTGELASLVPAKDTRGLSNRLSRTELHVSGQTVSLYRKQKLSAPLSKPVATASLEEFDAVESKIRRRESIVVTLDDKNCFVRKTTVPTAALAHVDRILDLEMSRVVPLRKDQSLTGWYKAGEVDVGRSDIVHVVARKSSVDDMIKLLTKKRAKAVALGFRSDGGVALPLVLDPNGGRFGASVDRFWKKTTAALGCLLLLASGSVAWAFLEYQNRAIATADAQLEDVQKPATEIRKKIDALQSRSQQSADLLALRSKTPSILAIWEELTHLLPDAAWVQSISQADNSLQLEGAATDAEGLIKILEASPLFRNVRFQSPVIKNPGDSQVRFSITLDLEGKSS